MKENKEPCVMDTNIKSFTVTQAKTDVSTLEKKS
jgi:hypothetical protein